MKLRFALVLSIAAPGFLGATQAASAETGEKTLPTLQTAKEALGDTIVRIAGVTQELSQLAATSLIGAPPEEEHGSTVETVPPAPVKPGKSSSSAKTAAPAKKPAGEQAAKNLGKRPAKDKAVARDEKIAEPSGGKAKRQQLAAAETKPMLVRCVGRPETGSAAWYGGRYLGRRTSSGERLDTIHATAAHRTLPLNSLARVTNLRNGRMVIVRVTDRGPVSDSLLIDMSPRAAEQLAMKDDGIVPVKVEQVVEVADAK